MASLARLDRCSVCHKTGGNHCMSCMTSEKASKLAAYTDEALIGLLASACAELDHRGSRLKIQVTA